MRHIFLSLWVTPFALLAASSSLAAEVRASSLLLENRLLVMCLPDFEAVSVQPVIQPYFKMDWEGFAERDLLSIEVNQKTNASRLVRFQKNANKTSTENSAMFDVLYQPIIGSQITRRANCKKAYEVILIGKDTGVKARWFNDFSQEDLFSRIDVMPMRMFEVRQKLDNK